MRFTVSLLILLLGTVSTADAQVRAFIGGTVVDGNGAAPIRDGVVLIDGAKIRAVGPRSRVAIPADAERVDVTGKFVLPGLIDGNVHLVPWPSWT